jgi:hypothetical protein
MRCGDDGDRGCDCDLGKADATLLQRALCAGETTLNVIDSSRPGTPVKKKPLGGAEVLTSGVGCEQD